MVLRPGPDGNILILNPSHKIRASINGQILVDERSLSSQDILEGVVWLIADQVALALHLTDPLTPNEPSFRLVGDSLGIRYVRQQISRVADLDVPCLIRGETGTGKEVVATAIHRASKRASRALEAINMGAIPPTLAASELFGAVKGAYTGADRKRNGAFIRADGGTLFLDEIGETPHEVQALLLRVLETSRVRPVGADQEQAVSVRILAATDADLETAVAEGLFRGPLVHRLSGYEIHIPPLRERIDDLGRLLIHFLRLELELAQETGRLDQRGPHAWLPAPLVASLASFHWPGNVRQLRNIVRQLVIASRGQEQLCLPPGLEAKLAAESRLGAESTPTIGSSASPASSSQDSPELGAASTDKNAANTPQDIAQSPKRPKYRSLDDVSEEELLEALRQHAFRLQPTAAALNISRTSLYALIERSSRIRKAKDLGREEIQDAKNRHDGDMNAMAAGLEVSRKGLRRQMTRLGFD